MEELCAICETELLQEETVEITQKRRESLDKAGKQRGDRIIMQLRKCKFLHKACYLHYTDERLIHAANKNADSSDTNPSNSQQSVNFSVNKLCIYCSEDASDDFLKKQMKKPVSRRIAVSKITNADIMKKRVQEIKERDVNSHLLQWLESIDLSIHTPRYHRNCFVKFLKTYEPHPVVTAKDTVVQYIIDYLNNHKEECQFFLKEILSNYEAPPYNVSYVLSELEKFYGHQIVITKTRGKDTVISLKDFAKNIIGKQFYENREKNESDERKRIVQAAAKIICEDIRSQVYDIDSYPIPNKFFEEAENDIPETLKIMLDTIIMKNKQKKGDKWKLRSTAIAHSIISAVRPRSFISSIQIALSLLLHSKTGSKDVVRLLNTLGFCASYDDCMKFQLSSIAHYEEPDFSHCFSQCVFDNADHNINTIDGLHTFHAMGGIHCVTPSRFITSETKIPILKTKLPPNTINKYRTTRILPFQKKIDSGISNIVVEDIYNTRPVNFDFSVSATDFSWIYSKNFRTKTPGWNGFLDQLYGDMQTEKSRVIFLPFVNAPASNYDTIFTVLHEAVLKGKASNQQKICVTFDQPLYWKAKDIVASSPENSELRNIIVRLGGFHLLMSFLGSIGHIMDNSGLKELFCEAFAPNTVSKMLEGHQYARAVRAHQLAHLALSKIIISEIIVTAFERNHIETLIDNTTGENLDKLNSDQTFLYVRKRFEDCLARLRENGPTAKLWTVYYNMVTLVKDFIDAERTGNWDKHIETIQKMLPYFHASRHFLYAKSAHLYVQDMLHLKEIMSQAEYHQFVNKGYFTIKRSDKFRCGVWSDMTIDQTLMKTMHSTGGLTRGRGMSDDVLTKWIMCMPTILDINQSLIEYCQLSLNSNSYQHVDATSARISRDDADCDTFFSWFSAHNPFPMNTEIINISSGFTGDRDVDCYKSLEIGRDLIQNMIGKNIKNVKFKRKMGVNTIKNIVVKKGIESNIAIDPAMLFQRICVLKKDNEELQDCFSYEMAPYPVTLFDETGMRKNVKSKFYDCFNPLDHDVQFDNVMYVIDGGFLLHRVVWNAGATYGDICQQYIT